MNHSPPSVDAIARYVAGAPAPVAVKKLTKDLRTNSGALEEAVRSGLVFHWPKYRGLARCWHLNPTEAIREAALANAAERAMPKPELIRAAARRAHNCGAAAAQSAVAALVREGFLAAAKTVGSTALYYDPKHPRALVDASMAIVNERLRKLNIDPAEPVQVVAAPPAPPLAGRILEGIRRLQPAPMIPVAVPALRAALPGVSKPDFDSTVLSLADAQQLYLTTHDHGWALPEAERDQLVWDGGRKLYVAATLRD